MNRSLEGKTAFVTGASKGIGAGIAKGLAAAGATTIVNYASSRLGADAVVDEIAAAGGKAWTIQGDFSKPDEVARVYAEIARRQGRLDVLVNNAGIYSGAPLEAVTAEHFHRHFDLNVLGLLLSAKEALPLFGAEGGSIINIGSVTGRMPPASMSVYAGTKGAVDSITIALSKELGPRKIRVNSLNPGTVETEGTASRGLLEGDLAHFVLAATPLGRFAQPKDIADVAVFLASEASSWVTGQTIFAAGGLTY